MNRTEIFQALIPILADRIPDSNISQITLGALIIEDLGADSLDNVEAIMEIEDHFGIEIVDKVAEKIKTVEDLVDAVFNLAPDEAENVISANVNNTGAVGTITPEPDPASTVPFTESDVKAYLDRGIRAWRIKRDDQKNGLEDRGIAVYYIDAYQSVRTSLFGETLP